MEQNKTAIKPLNFKNDEKDTTTNIIKKESFLKKTLEQIKDYASLQVMVPVRSRMKKRLETINNLSKAKHYKLKREVQERGTWVTEPPEMHIKNLRGYKLDNQTAKISFEVYDSDEEGNKKPHFQNTEIIREDGSKINRVTSAEYRVAYEVVEIIEYGKPIKREVLKIDLPKQEGN